MSNAKVSIKSRKSKYSAFSRINGDHPLKEAVPNVYVGYSAFHRHQGELAYFNFELAKEMGLIPEGHAHSMNAMLQHEIEQAFSIQIINEYDVLHHVKINSGDVCDHQYMATRYLQLQHPNKQGKTSGDGRSIWNGHFKGTEGHWDISSCGTGATRLSPASAIEQTFFKTGGKNLSYGCGKADFSEGLISALFSEILFKNGMATERILAIIRFKNGSAINVRASKNLLRPAHFFGYVKRNDFESLSKLVDYYIQRQVENNELEITDKSGDKYQIMLMKIADDFAKATARFESEYIFCWMDWDGDNILMDGGVIDYGTIRQFGLFHHEYRYDDVDKMSTTITEQKKKARNMVQVFSQIVDFLETKTRKPLKEFSHASALTLFDERFDEYLRLNLLQKIGYTKEQQLTLLSNNKACITITQFLRKFRVFEKAVSRRKAHKVADGITRDAIFCMRDFLREFPAQLKSENHFYSAKSFIELIASNYSSQRDCALYARKIDQIETLQACYVEVMSHCHYLTGIPKSALLQQLVSRSSKINPHEKLTGNAVINIANMLLKKRAQLSFSEMNTLLHLFVRRHIYEPDFVDEYSKVPCRKTKLVATILKWSNKVIKNHHVGL